jgi:hypothetical protein
VANLFAHEDSPAPRINLSKDSLLDQKIGGSNSFALDIIFPSKLAKEILNNSMLFATLAMHPRAIALSDGNRLKSETTEIIRRARTGDLTRL